MSNIISSLLFKQRLLVRAYKYLFKFDKDEINYIRQFLEEGDSAFDIGAHKGAYTYWMEKSVGKKGEIVCIEPQPILFQYLRKMKDIFAYENLSVMDCALSDKEGDGEISIPAKKGGISQCARINDESFEFDQEFYNVKVKIRSLDGIVAETGIKPKLVKIDVEGHELQVLKGMTKTLKEIKPSIILECEERHINGTTVYDVFEFLKEKGYRGFYFQRGCKNPIKNFDLERDQRSYFINNKRLDHNYINNFIFEAIG